MKQLNRVLLSGASGFLGRALALRLARAGLEVVALVRDPERARGVLERSAPALDLDLRRRFAGGARARRRRGQSGRGAPLRVDAGASAGARSCVRAAWPPLRAWRERSPARPGDRRCSSRAARSGSGGIAATSSSTNVPAQARVSWPSCAARGRPRLAPPRKPRSARCCCAPGWCSAPRAERSRRCCLHSAWASGSTRPRAPVDAVDPHRRLARARGARAARRVALGGTGGDRARAGAQLRVHARALGQALRRPTPFPVPGVALELVLGEVASLLLTGQRVRPTRALAAGFAFRFPTLAGALEDLVAPDPTVEIGGVLATYRMPSIAETQAALPARAAHADPRAPRAGVRVLLALREPGRDHTADHGLHHARRTRPRDARWSRDRLRDPRRAGAAALALTHRGLWNPVRASSTANSKAPIARGGTSTASRAPASTP